MTVGNVPKAHELIDFSEELTFMEEISCEIFTPLPDGEQEEGLIDSDFDFSGDDTDTESNIS